MYYIGNVPFGQDDLQHWGVLGMKWGIRRYQNSDGTLTEAGKKRYGANGKYEYKSIGQKFKQHQVNKARVKDKQLMDKVAKSTIDNKDGTVTITDTDSLFKSGKVRSDLWKKESQLKAYKKRDADRQKYAEKTSGLKAGVQKGLKMTFGSIAMPGGIDVQYQRARSRGEGRIKSILTSRSMLVGIGSLAGALAGGGLALKSSKRTVSNMLDIIGKDVLKPKEFADLQKFVDTMGKGAVTGAVSGYAGSKIHTMNENKKKYGHRMWT